MQTMESRGAHGHDVRGQRGASDPKENHMGRETRSRESMRLAREQSEKLRRQTRIDKNARAVLPAIVSKSETTTLDIEAIKAKFVNVQEELIRALVSVAYQLALAMEDERDSVNRVQ